MTVNYFSRNQKAGYSIQKVFSIIQSEVALGSEIKTIYLPHLKTSVINIIRNMLYAYSKKQKNTINHITGEVHYLSLVLNYNNTIITVHDIGLIEVLTGVKQKIWSLLWVKTLKKAKYITFVSEYSKNKVLQYVDLSKNNLYVIPNPVGSEYIFKLNEFNNDYPRILHIGTAQNKNLIRTIKAIQNIHCHLRIIGELNSEVLNELTKRKIDYSNAYKLNDEEIVKEYIECDIVNFPSTHEGFGMPIIEAQAIGRVILTSNIEPMKSIASDGALLVDPFNIDSIHNGLLQLINDEKLRNELIINGVRNVRKYNKKYIGRMYKELYMEVQENIKKH